MKSNYSFLEEVLYTNEDIVAKCEELGQRITKDYEGKNPVLVGLLKGSVPFMAELIKHIKCDIELEFMQVSSYQGISSTLEVKVVKDLSMDVTGRHLIFVEDIVDTGLTLKKVLEMMAERAPLSVEVVSLLDKPEGRKVENLNPKYTGFIIPNKFVVGFGLDYDQKYRNIECVGVLKKEVYMK